MTIWSDDPKEAKKQIIDELERLLVLGFAEIVGVDEKGDDLYVITQAGSEYLSAMRGIADDVSPRTDDLI